ncbi:MFS transporter [Mycolicibacterium goodii]|uniref:MFS transporter n=1 Tax=Mycolicibacterium goodii TaxID=134601 RepID=A0ABS6HUD6_MYCGD|nr:MFS transporter [Mycolicibacterium goodii]MBU8825140.1 MFS transporter [Mycolicibacterium goodii]MBU8838146.1 MFS transporter [Mycolicibacterium goodii]OKH70411.1 MFS transporter [Mycobacterium sp. SWH-M5]
MRRYLAATFNALSIRDYRRYALGQTISVSGTWMQKLTQAWLILELTDSPLLLGITVAGQQLPTLLFTTVAGVLADRYSKRTILLWTAIGGMLPALMLGVLVWIDVVNIWIILAAAVAQGFADAIDKPARLTFVNDIATPETMANAVTLNSIIQNSGKIAGPAVAGVLISAVGVSTSFFLNAASYLPVVIALLSIRPRAQVTTGTVCAKGHLGETLRYVSARPHIAAALVLMAVSGLLTFNWNVLLPTLARDTFGGDARVVGFAFTSMGVGAVFGGLALAGALRGTSKWLILNGCVLGAALSLTGLMPTVTIAYALLFVVGAASVTFRSTATTLLQLHSDPGVRGRIISLLVLATNGTTPLGGPLIGWICAHANPRVACLVGGLGTVAAALAHWAHLRKADTRKDPIPLSRG